MRGLTNFFNSLRIQTLSPLTRAIVVALVFTGVGVVSAQTSPCLLYTSPSPRDKRQSRMPSSA